MADLMGYLKWRGDLTMAQAPFNEVDSLALAMITYADFTGIVPPEGTGKGITLRAAVKAYFTRRVNEQKMLDRAECCADREELLDAKPQRQQDVRVLRLGVLLPGEIHKLMLKMATTPRFQNVLLARYSCELQEGGDTSKQFSAVTFQWRDSGTGLFVSFRGTDDTLAGCREDLNLSFMDEIPSQRRATQYLDALHHEGRLSERTRLYVGGHSKGGNLAVWSAVHTHPEVRARIAHVYNHDGPGFSAALLASDAYRELDGRITTLVPQDSLVGLLLENDGKFQIVRSPQFGLYQHNGMRWAVEGPAFVRMRNLSRFGHSIDTVTRGRIASMTAEERRTLTNLLFEVLESTGARTLSELSEDKLAHALTMAKTVNRYDPTTRKLLWDLLMKLFVSRPTPAPKALPPR